MDYKHTVKQNWFISKPKRPKLRHQKSKLPTSLYVCQILADFRRSFTFTIKMCQWKNFENRSIFGAVMDKKRWLTVFGPTRILKTLNIKNQRTSATIVIIIHLTQKQFSTNRQAANLMRQKIISNYIPIINNIPIARQSVLWCKNLTTLCLKKTSPTFMTITWKSVNSHLN